ncbi:MAG: carboxypeptidase regulatory-like domain-containing protein [Acidimicrobiales bacterium]
MGITVERALATPGEPGQLVVRITNVGDVAASYIVRVVGLAEDWVQPPIATGPIDPGASELVAIRIELPLGFPASRQLIAVVAEPVGGTASTLRAQTELVVGDGDQVELRLEPPYVRGGGSGRFDVKVVNRGNEPLGVRLEPDTPAGHLKVDLNPAALWLPPGAVAWARGTVRGRRPFTGRGRRLPFGVTGRGPVTPPRAEGSFSQRPLMSAGAMKLTAILVLVGLWAGLMVVGFQYLEGRDDSEEVAGDEAAAEGAAEDGGEDGAGGGDQAGGGGEDGADGAAEDDDGVDDDAARGVRVGGTVDARDPAGVIVRIEPISLVEEDAQAATFDRGITRSAGAGKRVGPAVGRPGRILPPVRTTTTDDTGAWAFAGVPNPGFYLLTFSKAGYAERSHVVDAKEDGEPVELDVILEAGRGSLSGIVRGPNGPLGGVDITVSDGTVSFGTSTPTAGGDVGRWSVEGLSTPGSYLVTASRFGFGTETALVELGSGGSSSVDLVMQDGVGTLSGVVSSDDGPLGNIEVTVSDGELTRTATTFTEGVVGAYHLPQLPIPGTYTVTASGTGWSTATQVVELTGNQTLPIQLESTTGVIFGVITGLDPNDLQSEEIVPIQGAGVTLSNDSLTLKNTSVADPPGAFELTGVLPGTYVLTVSFAGLRSESQLVEFVPGQPPAPINFAMAVRETAEIPDGGRIFGDVRDNRTNALLPNVQVRLVERDLSAFTGPDGRFELPPPEEPGLEPGVYNLEVSADSYIPTTSRLTVPADVRLPTAFRLVPFSTVGGVVRLATDGSPLANATVTVTDQAGAEAAEPQLTDSLGRYSFHQAFAPGSYVFRVEPPAPPPLLPGYIAHPPLEVDLELGEDIPNLDFRLDRFGQLRVFVTKPAVGGAAIASGAAIEVSGPAGTFNATVQDTLPVRFNQLSEPGDYDIDVTLDGFASVAIDSVAVPINAVIDRHVLLLPNVAGVVNGSIVYVADGVETPVTGATVQIRGVFGYIEVSGSPPISETRTESFVSTDGSFAIDREHDGCPPSTAPGVICGKVPLDLIGSVTITHPDFEPLTVNPVDFAAAVANPLRFVLTPRPGFVSGTVDFNPPPPGGDPVITVTGMPPGVTGVVARITSTPGADQTTFVLRDPALGSPDRAPIGTYTLRVTRTGFIENTAQVTVQPNQTSDVSVTLQKTASITAHALGCPSGDTCPDPTAFDSVQVVFELYRVDTDQLVRTLPASGTSSTETFGSLTPGVDYRVEARGAGLQLRDPPGFPVVNDLGAGATEEVDVEFTVLGSIAVKVQGNTAGNITDLGPGIVVRAIGPGCVGPTGCRATTGQDSIATITPLQAGDYDLDTIGPAAGYDLADGVDTAVAVVGGQATSRTFVLDALPATLEGTVRDEANNPLSGVTVSVLLSTGGSARTATTDSNGVYRIQDLTPVSANVTFSKTDFASVTVVAVPLPRGGTFTLDQTMAKKLNTIVGRVTATFGTTTRVPVEGATVQAVAIIGGTVGAQTTTDANGDFTLDDVPAGSYRIEATMDGFDPPTSPFPQTTVSGGQTVQVPEITLVGQVRLVNVTVKSINPDGSELLVGGSTVTLEPQQPNRDTLTATTNADGVASFIDVQLNTRYDVTAAGPDPHHSGTAELPPIKPSDGNGPFAVTVDLDEGVLMGTATVDGGFDAGITIEAVASDGATFSTNPNAADGTYELYLPPGDYDVTASLTGAGSVALDDVTITKGQVMSGQDFALRTTGELLAVVVTDPTGAAVQGATVRVTPGPSTPADKTTNVNGRARFTLLQPGTYAIEVQRGTETPVAKTDIVVVAGAQTRVDVTLPVLPGHLEVHVTSGGADVQGAVVTITSGPTSPPNETTDTGGLATFSNLAPGTYAISVQRGTETPVTASGIVVSSGATAQETVDLPAPPTP